jgi:hypothetical protein
LAAAEAVHGPEQAVGPAFGSQIVPDRLGASKGQTIVVRRPAGIVGVPGKKDGYGGREFVVGGDQAIQGGSVRGPEGGAVGVEMNDKDFLGLSGGGQ